MDKRIKLWRGLNHPNQAIVWAHMRLDRIEKHLGLAYVPPDIDEIINKMHDEAEYEQDKTDKSKPSIFQKFFTNKRIIGIHPDPRHSINRIFRNKKRKSKDNATDKIEAQSDDN